MRKKKIKPLDIDNCSTGVALQKTVQYLQSPDKANDAHIQFIYGTRCMKKTGMPVTKERIKEAEAWFTKAANQGYALAHLSLGSLYIGAYPESHLRVIERDEQKALEHFQYAAEQDIPEAQYRLAMILEKAPDKLQLAVSWLMKAAAKHKSAQCRLALMYMKGNPIISQDKARGIEMLEIAAQQGHPEALYHLGRAYEKGDGVAKDDVKAVELLSQAATKKYKDALLHLATKYELGDGVSKDDTEAIRLLTLAANVEYPEAQLRLAIKYELGEGISKDDNQAIRLLIQAAQLGYTEAQFYLAIKYEEGDGIDKEEDKALELFTKTAEKGYKEAQFHLGVKYHNGRGIEKDEVQAVDWLTRAADASHLGAKEYLRNLVEKSICLNDIYAGTKQLIRVSQRIFGEKQDITKMFHNLLPEGIPELEDETFYYYTYKIFPSEEGLPSVKQPGIVYLYIKNDKLNYYILNSCSSGLEEKVYSGTSHLPPDLDLSCLQDVVERQLIEKECIEPSYEVRRNMQRQYEEFFLYEKKFSAFLLNLLGVLESQEFRDCIQGNDDFNVLKDNITTTAKNLLQNQILICKNLEREFKDSSQMIDVLTEAYGTTINLEDFYNMGCYMKQLDKQFEYLSAKKKTLVKIIFHPLGLTTVCSPSMNGENFQTIFFRQYTISRKVLCQNLATYFRKRHPKFYQLEPIFIMFEKMVSVSNMTHDNTHLMVMSNLQTQLIEENNKFKMTCFELIQPICYLLIMETQQTPISVIYKSLLEKQKPILLKAMLDLQKHISDFKRKSDVEAEILLCPNADNIQELFNNVKGTSNLSDIIWILVKAIQTIEPFILELNASRNSQGANRRSSDDSSENTQSLGSLQSTSEDLLSEPVLSPKGNKRKSVGMAELKRGKRRSIMVLGQLSSRMSRKNEAILEPVLENEHEYKSSALSPGIGSGRQEPLSVDDIGLMLCPNKSESDSTPSNLSNAIENCNKADQDPLAASTSSHIRDSAYSPIGMGNLISPKVRYRDTATNIALNPNESSSQRGDITLRSIKGDGERSRSAKRNRRGTFHLSDPVGLNQDLSSNSSQDPIRPKKGKSLKEKLAFFHSDNTNASDVKNSLSSSLQPA